MKHSLKTSRYRICFQTKNKVWIYKNSRLRNFYKLRSRIILKTGKFQKNFLILKNMKWTVARRQMVPYFRKKSRFFYLYKNLFFIKQRLKIFYGGLKEYRIRTIFKRTWNKEQYFKTNNFLGGLEQRVGTILFRMRLLPTIFACNQFILHQGILINNQKITNLNYRVNIGDIIALSNDYWFIFYDYLFERINNRLFGQSLLEWRRLFFFKKIRFYRLKKKFVYIKNFKLIKRFQEQKNRAIFLKKYLKTAILIAKKHSTTAFSEFLQFFYFIFYQKIYLNLKKIKKYLKILWKWVDPTYYSKVNYMILTLFGIKRKLNHYFYLFLKFYNQWILEKIENLKIEYFQIKKKNSNVSFSFNIAKIILKIKEQNLSNLMPFKIILHKRDQAWKNWLFQYWKLRFKKYKFFKSKLYENKRYFNFLIRRLKYRKFKRKKFKTLCKQVHWFVPNYLEMDFCTLRVICIEHPKINQVFYGFKCSFKKIVSFYKERAL